MKPKPEKEADHAYLIDMVEKVPPRLAEFAQQISKAFFRDAALKESILAELERIKALFEEKSTQPSDLTLALMRVTALMQQAGFAPFAPAARGNRACIDACHAWADALAADCGGDLACIATANAFRALCVACCYAYPGHAPLGGIRPPLPGPPEEWPERPPWWPPPFPWPPVIINSPGTPISSAPPPAPAPSGRCQVSVSLLRVSYTGGNEGNDWRIRTTVQGREYRFRQRIINNGETSAFGQEVFKEEVGTCNTKVTIDILCTAIEVDTPDPNEVGTADKQVSIDCPGQEIVSITVNVDSAVMTFVLSVDATCK